MFNGPKFQRLLAERGDAVAMVAMSLDCAGPTAEDDLVAALGPLVAPPVDVERLAAALTITAAIASGALTLLADAGGRDPRDLLREIALPRS